MDFAIEGIQCDAPGCDYADMNIEWGTTPEDILAKNDEFLTALCPKCGARLLTDEDHANVKLMVLLQPELTALEEELCAQFPGEVTDEKVKMEIIMDGSGKIGIGDIKVEGEDG